MKYLGNALSFLGFVLGFVSAYYWFQASKVAVSPAWELEIRGDVDKNIMGWVTGNMIAFKKSGELNKRAALWTAAAVAVSTLASAIPLLG